MSLTLTGRRHAANKGHFVCHHPAHARFRGLSAWERTGRLRPEGAIQRVLANFQLLKIAEIATSLLAFVLTEGARSHPFAGRRTSAGAASRTPNTCGIVEQGERATCDGTGPNVRFRKTTSS